MDSALRIAAVLLPLLYLLTAGAYGFYFFGARKDERLPAWCLRATVTVHAVQLVLLSLRWHQFPAATVSQALSVLAFAVAVVYVFVEWHGRSRATGFWLLSLAFCFELMASLVRNDRPPDLEIFHNPLFAVHVSLGLLGYAAFVVAACDGFLFLRLYAELKRGRYSLFFGQLPPLEVLERMMRGALIFGMVGLTGTLVSGIAWAEQLFEGRWIQDPKVLATLATWLFYALVLAAHGLRDLRGRKLAWCSLIGLGAVLFSLVAINLFFTDVHAFP